MQKLKQAKRITKATLKSFIKRNSDKIYTNELSSYDGMQDMVTKRESGFTPAEVDMEKVNKGEHYILDGVYLVYGKNWFDLYEDDNFIGIEVYNSCGNSVVAIKK